MPIFDEIKKNRDKILDLANKFGLTDIRVFGSVARGEEKAESDIDILVHYSPQATLMKHAGFMVEMEKIFGRKVDVVEDSRLHWAIRDDVLSGAKPV